MSASPICSPWLKVMDSISAMARCVIGSVTGRSEAARRVNIFCTAASSALLRMPLQHFEKADGRQHERAEFIESPRGLAVAALMPNQHSGIDQHWDSVQDSLREPSRL